MRWADWWVIAVFMFASMVFFICAETVCGREYCPPVDPDNIPTFYYTSQGVLIETTRVYCPRPENSQLIDCAFNAIALPGAFIGSDRTYLKGFDEALLK